MAKGSTRVKVSLSDKGLRSSVKSVFGNRKSSVLVGVFGDKAAEIHEPETPGGKSKLSVGEIAACHEFGFGVPERSWLRSYIDANQERLAKMLLAGMTDALKRCIQTGQPISDKDRYRILGLIGEQAKAEIQARISNGEIGPPLAEATIVAKTRQGKRGDIPLVFAGQMRSAISYEVDLTGLQDTDE